MESFDGIAVLTTNLRANLDEAFTRRLDVVADFPVPDADQRLALWDRCLGTDMPRDGGLDLDFCAGRFELAGGSIRACAVTAAYLAAEAGTPVGMAQVVAAVLQEYRKLGRLVLESEFGPWARRSPARERLAVGASRRFGGVRPGKAASLPCVRDLETYRPAALLPQDLT